MAAIKRDSRLKDHLPALEQHPTKDIPRCKLCKRLFENQDIWNVVDHCNGKRHSHKLRAYLRTLKSQTSIADVFGKKAEEGSPIQPSISLESKNARRIPMVTTVTASAL